MNLFKFIILLNIAIKFRLIYKRLSLQSIQKIYQTMRIQTNGKGQKTLRMRCKQSKLDRAMMIYSV